MNRSKIMQAAWTIYRRRRNERRDPTPHAELLRQALKSAWWDAKRDAHVAEVVAQKIDAAKAMASRMTKADISAELRVLDYASQHEARCNMLRHAYHYAQ